MGKFIQKIEFVTADQYFPGINIDGVEVIRGANDGIDVEIATIRLWDTVQVLQPGDWIVRTENSVTVWSNDVFVRHYEPV